MKKKETFAPLASHLHSHTQHRLFVFGASHQKHSPIDQSLSLPHLGYFSLTAIFGYNSRKSRYPKQVLRHTHWLKKVWTIAIRGWKVVIQEGDSMDQTRVTTDNQCSHQWSFEVCHNMTIFVAEENHQMLKRHPKIRLKEHKRTWFLLKKRLTLRFNTISMLISDFLVRDVKWKYIGHMFDVHDSSKNVLHRLLRYFRWKDSTSSTLLQWEISWIISDALGNSQAEDEGRRKEM